MENEDGQRGADDHGAGDDEESGQVAVVFKHHGHAQAVQSLQKHETLSLQCRLSHTHTVWGYIFTLLDYMLEIAR